MIYPKIGRSIMIRKEISMLQKVRSGNEIETKKLDEALAMYQKIYEEAKYYPTRITGILNEDEVNYFLRDWTRIAGRSGVKISSLKMGKPENADFSKIFPGSFTLSVQELPMDISLECKFENLISFFEILQRVARLPKIERIDIKESKYPELNIDIQAKLYIGS